MQPFDFTRFFGLLNDEQRRAVTCSTPYQLVVAGAGSGKTRVLTSRAAWLCAQGVAPEQVLLLTFTNKAARQMRERLCEIHPGIRGICAGTFHAVAHRLIQQAAELLGYRPGYTILGMQDALDICEAARAAVVGDDKQFPKAEWLQSVFSHALNVDCALTDFVRARFPKFASQLSVIDQVCTEYLKRKLAQNAMDYDDLLVNLRLLLEDDASFREALSARFSHVLIDEYQDTNRLQVSLLRLLHPQHLMAVGDDCQSIYAFRGADSRNFLHFNEDFPGAALFKLETCYRCSPQIVALANASISQNREQFHKVLHSELPEGPKPAVIHLKSAFEQAKFVVQKLLELQAMGLPWSEQAVLFRAHYQSLELQLELQRHGIPFEIRGGVRFFDQAHIRDVLSHLRILQNPMDRMSWLRVLRLRPGIGMRGAEAIFDALSLGGDPWGALRAAELKLKRAVRGWQQTQEFLLKIAKLEHSPSAMIEALLESGYRDYLQRSYEDAADRLDEIYQLGDFAETCTSRQQFLDELSLLEGASLAEASGEQPLCLTTVHQAKGLEWSAVFVLSVAQGQFPMYRSCAQPELLEEERRLFYVALTRAKRWLYLCAPRWGNDRGGPLAESLFLSELGSDLGRLVTFEWPDEKA